MKRSLRMEPTVVTGYTPDQVREMLAGDAVRLGSQRALARAADCSEQFLSDILRSLREPGDKTLAYLGLVKRVVYSPKGRGK